MCESVNPYTGNQSDKTTLGATVQVGELLSWKVLNGALILNF